MRKVGAIAGLVPAALASILWVLAQPNGAVENAVAPAAASTVGFVIVGWIAGPLARGSGRADLKAAAGFALLVALLFLVIGAISAAFAAFTADRVDVTTRLASALTRAAYGLLYLPFWAGLVTPFAASWVIAIRTYRRMTGRPVDVPTETRSSRRSLFGAVDPSRMVRVAALMVGPYAVFVATVPLVLYDAIRPPWALSRPIALVVLFAVPALLAVIGSRTNVRAFVVVGGVLCLLQSAISFSGITVGFIVPALILLVAGTSERWPDSSSNDPPSMVAGVASLGLVVGAWMAFLTLTEEVCWYASRAADGSLAYHRMAVTDVMTVPPEQVAGGCDGGTLTFEALAVGAILTIGALAIAIMTGTRRVAPRGDL